jgi:hypothetical protein
MPRSTPIPPLLFSVRGSSEMYTLNLSHEVYKNLLHTCNTRNTQAAQNSKCCGRHRPPKNNTQTLNHMEVAHS